MYDRKITKVEFSNAKPITWAKQRFLSHAGFLAIRRIFAAQRDTVLYPACHTVHHNRPLPLSKDHCRRQAPAMTRPVKVHQ